MDDHPVADRNFLTNDDVGVDQASPADLGMLTDKTSAGDRRIVADRGIRLNNGKGSDTDILADNRLFRNNGRRMNPAQGFELIFQKQIEGLGKGQRRIHSADNGLTADRNVQRRDDGRGLGGLDQGEIFLIGDKSDIAFLRFLDTANPCDNDTRPANQFAADVLRYFSQSLLHYLTSSWDNFRSKA